MSNGHASDYDAQITLLQQKWAPVAPVITSSLFQSLLRIQGLAPPTKIQLKAIPCILQVGEDIVAQVSSPLEGVVSYALPAVQLCTSSLPGTSSPVVLIVNPSVEGASFAYQICQQLGAPLGIRSLLTVSPSAAEDHSLVQRSRPHILIGTPQTVLDLLAMRSFGADGGPKLVVLDDADSLVNNNQAELVFNIMRLLPSGSPATSVSKGFDPFGDSTPASSNSDSRIVRQTAILGRVMSPELLNFASSLQLREPVRVLVRKTAVAASNGSSTPVRSSRPSSGMDGVMKGVRHYFLYVAIANRSHGSRGEEASHLDFASRGY